MDSLDELERTARAAREAGLPTRVRLRVRPWLSDADLPSDLAAGSPAHLAVHDYRPGVPGDEIAACVALARAEPLVELIGLHAHIGRQSTRLALWRALGSWMADTVAALDIPVREVSFGGGFAMPGDPTGQAHERRHDPPPGPEAYLHAVLGAFARGLETHAVPVRGLRVEIEPGRAIFGNAGLHLATVLHVKTQRGPVERLFVETDTSEAFLPDVVWEASRFDVVPVTETSPGNDAVTTVTGTSCGFDVLRGPEPGPLPRVGDVLAFLDTGAYQDSTANNFNLMGRPPLVLVDGDLCRLVRRREEYDDVMARETDEPPVSLA